MRNKAQLENLLGIHYSQARCNVAKRYFEPVRWQLTIAAGAGMAGWVFAGPPGAIAGFGYFALEAWEKAKEGDDALSQIDSAASTFSKSEAVLNNLPALSVDQFKDAIAQYEELQGVSDMLAPPAHPMPTYAEAQAQVTEARATPETLVTPASPASVTKLSPESVTRLVTLSPLDKSAVLAKVDEDLAADRKANFSRPFNPVTTSELELELINSCLDNWIKNNPEGSQKDCLQFVFALSDAQKSSRQGSPYATARALYLAASSRATKPQQLPEFIAEFELVTP